MNYDLSKLQTLEVINYQGCREVCITDASSLSSNPKRFVEANSLSYYVLINTWLLIIREDGDRGMLELEDAIRHLGLIHVIRDCATCADMLIANEIGYPSYILPILLQCKDLKGQLQSLRYPKRFSPAYADRVQEITLKKFVSINNRCKQIQRRENNYYIISQIRSWVTKITSGFTVDYTDSLFSNGVAADANRSLKDKLLAYSKDYACLYHPLYPISSSELYGIRATYGSHQRTFIKHVAQVAAVNKSYKAARIIAFEDASRQFNMQAIRFALERCIILNGFKPMLSLHEQELNQNSCRIGSIDGSRSTIDLSSASDSITRSLVYSIFPEHIVREIEKWLPTHMTLPGCPKETIMHMFCTSGNAVTFVVESITFLAICLVAKDLYHDDSITDPSVYGDDMVVDSKIFNTVIELLQSLGFTVNTEKSFDDSSNYKESCGVEYEYGIDTTTKYFPRKTLVWQDTRIPITISSLCSLEHRLYGYWYARKFLIRIIRIFEPRMTSHIYSTDCTDLWEEIPQCKICWAPGAKHTEISDIDIDKQYLTRELHLTLVSKYPKYKGDTTMLDMWHYVHFLIHGPKYSDEFLESLHISDVLSNYDAETGVSTNSWAYVAE